jgi:hypothetical protein
MGCGGTTDDTVTDPDVKRYTLQGNIGQGEALFLASGSIVDGADAQNADIHLHLGMAFQLTGPEGAFSFCDKGDGWKNIHDIPTSTEDCTADYVSLGGNSPGATRTTQGDGYLVPDASGRWYALHVVKHSIDPVAEGGTARVTFDVLPLD